MSVQAITWAFKQDITPAGLKFVLVALANYASEDGYCYPSQKTLGNLTGQSVRAVNAHLVTLEERGYIKRAHRFREDGGQTSDGFYLQTARAEDAPTPMQISHTPPEDGTYAPVQILHTPPAKSASNTKDHTKRESKEDTKEDTRASRAAASGVPYSPPPLPLSSQYESDNRRRAFERSEIDRENRRRKRMEAGSR